MRIYFRQTNNESESQFSKFGKPLSAQTSIRGINHFNDYPIKGSKINQNLDQRAINEK